MIKGLNHIGIAVRAVADRLAFYRAMGLEVSGSEEVPSELVRVATLSVAGSRVELLEPTAAESPIAKFIAKRGEGLHHICFEVDDIRAAMHDLGSQGFELVSAEPKRGADGTLVCFVHPRSVGGVLIELCQMAQ